jgi:hypothetical protein
MLEVCRGSPEGKDLEDSVSVTFAHPSIAEGRPGYQIDVQRAFPDVALAPRGKIIYSFDKLRAELFRVYGRPLEQRMEAITPAAADLEKTLSVGTKVKRDDRRVQYLWAAQGHLEENLETPTCNLRGAVCPGRPRDIEVPFDDSKKSVLRPTAAHSDPRRPAWSATGRMECAMAAREQAIGTLGLTLLLAPRHKFTPRRR